MSCPCNEPGCLWNRLLRNAELEAAASVPAAISAPTREVMLALTTLTRERDEARAEGERLRAIVTRWAYVGMGSDHYDDCPGCGHEDWGIDQHYPGCVVAEARAALQPAAARGASGGYVAHEDPHTGELLYRPAKETP